MGCNKDKPTEIIDDGVTLPVNPPWGQYHFYASWSPDGNKIMFVNWDYPNVPDSMMGLWTVSPDGSNLQPFVVPCLFPQLAVISGGILFYGSDWSPDGRWVVASINLDIYKLKANGDSLTRLTNMGYCSFPAWSKDGNNIAFTKRADSSGIWVMDKDGGGLRMLAPNYESPTWLDDNKNVLGLVSSTDPADGYYLFYLKKINIDTGDTILVDTIYGRTLHAQYSPDGSKIVLECQKYLLLPQIYTISAAGGNHVNLMGDPSVCENIGEHPCWSTDGTKIVYNNCCRDNGKLWIMNADGTGKYQLTP